MLGAPPYDLYDINDLDKYEIMDAVLYLFPYPAIAYIMLNFYWRWKLKGVFRTFYIWSWAIFTMCMEWFAKLAHVFTYKGWQLWYSLFVYIVVYTLHILAIHLANNLLNRNLTSE